MTQPGSLRDSAVSFSKIAATSDSRPIFAIHVTANTTIHRSVLSLRNRASERASNFRRPAALLKQDADTSVAFSRASQSQRIYKFGNQNRLVAIGPGGNHPYPRSSFLFDES